MSNVGFITILNDVDFIGMAIWTSLEGYWLLILPTLLILWKNKEFTPFLLLSSLIFILTLGALSVFDKTRSGSYLFPSIFISIYILNNIFSKNDLQKILFICATVCFLFPAYYIISDVSPYTLWYKPIFVRVLDLARIHFYGN